MIPIFTLLTIFYSYSDYLQKVFSPKFPNRCQNLSAKYFLGFCNPPYAKVECAKVTCTASANHIEQSTQATNERS